MNKFIKLSVLTILFLINITCCKKKEIQENQIDTSVPVTLTTIDTTAIDSYVDLNATATFLVKNIIKANATGYLSAVNAQSNDFVFTL